MKYRFVLLFSLLWLTMILIPVIAISQSFTASNLPIVIINTDNGFPIPDEPKVGATMKIIYNGAGQRNSVTDLSNSASLNYNGRIGIETRGSSSQALNKKQYGFTTLMTDNITNNNVSLLGMPKENDWILSGLAFDASLLRDYLSFTLSRKIGQYAPRAQYCEVVINGDYRGVYMIVEKIKADDNRVDILKIDPTNNLLPDVSGGYITKADKIAGVDVSAWKMSNYNGGYTDFVHEFPKPSSVTAAQNTYIQTVFSDLANKATNSSITTGFPSVIDIPSFIDFMIINELGSNVDAYQFSTYFHKDRNGKLRAGPVWDMNLTYGHDLVHWGFNRSLPNVWQFDNGDNIGPKFWKDLYNNSTFHCYLSKRWNALTQAGAPLSQASLYDLIDETAATISEGAARDYVRWQSDYNAILVTADLNTQVAGIKNFINTRIPWMTTQLGSYSTCTNVIVPPLVITRINYHPETNTEFPKSDDLEFVEITNNGGATVDLKGIYFGGAGFVFQFEQGAIIPPNAAIQVANSPTTFIQKHGYSPYGNFTRNLSNGHQRLTLVDAYGNLIDEVEYFTEAPWPDADGNGSYLKLTNINSDNNVGSNWEASQEKIASAVMITGIEESRPDEIQIYPNPAEDLVIVTSSSIIKQIQLLDTRGMILTSIAPESSQTKIDLRYRTPGLYLIKVQTINKNRIIKVIRQD